MSQPDLKKRTRKSTKNDDDSLNKPKPKKGRGKAIEKEETNEDNTPSKDLIMASSETNASSSLIDDIEDGGSKAQTSKKWTPEQRLQLIEAVLKHVKIPWDEVCNDVDGGKSGKMCYDQWRRKIVPGLKSFIKSENGN